MQTVERSVIVNVPLEIAYRHWADVTSFPSMMSTVKKVTRTGQDTYHWETSVGPVTQEFDARAEFQPDQRISWHSTSGEQNRGSVTFTREGQARTRVDVHLDYEPSNPVEKLVDDWTHLVGDDLTQALHKFKAIVEAETPPTGGATLGP